MTTMRHPQPENDEGRPLAGPAPKMSNGDDASLRHHRDEALKQLSLIWAPGCYAATDEAPLVALVHAVLYVGDALTAAASHGRGEGL
jgi:hypothetical protein